MGGGVWKRERKKPFILSSDQRSRVSVQPDLPKHALVMLGFYVEE